MSNFDLDSILSTTRLSQYLNRHELHTLVKSATISRFPSGKYILKQGKVADGFYIILEGKAVITAKILGEGTTKLASLGHGNLMGEVSIIDKSPSSISAISNSEMACLFITNKALEILSIAHPDTYYQLKRAIANEICGYLKNFHQKITQIMQQTDMTTRSLFSSVIKSLHKPILLDIQETENYASQLPGIDFFTNFTSAEKTELIKNCDLIKAPNECILIQENDVDSSLYIVLFGAVQSSIIHDNKVAKLSVLGPLDFFSSISIFDNSTPSIINYATCERTILLKIPQENIESLQQNKTVVWYKIFDLICQSLVMLARSAEKLDIRLNSELYNR